MRPFALHLIDGDILVLWSSLKSFDKWISAFKRAQITAPDGFQKVLLKIKTENAFSMCVFMSLAPHAPHRKRETDLEKLEPEQNLTVGYCLKSVKVLKFLQQDYVYKRHIKIDLAQNVLNVYKDQHMTA